MQNIISIPFWRPFSRWTYLKSREKSKQTMYHQLIITRVPQRTSRCLNRCLNQGPKDLLENAWFLRPKHHAAVHTFPTMVHLPTFIWFSWQMYANVMYDDVGIYTIHGSYCWWKKIPNNHLGCIKPCKQWKNYQPQLVSRISEPSTVSCCDSRDVPRQSVAINLEEAI